MKIWILFVCILFTIPTVAFSETNQQTQTAEKQKIAKPAKEKVKTNTDEFTTLVADYYKAWNTLDLQNPAKYYAKEPGLIFFDIAPLQYKGWNEYQAGVKKLLDGFTSFKLIPNDDLVVTRKGKVAWMTLTFRISGKQKTGPAMELDCRHTAIWEKRKGNWLIVHEHVSAPLPPMTAK